MLWNWQHPDGPNFAWDQDKMLDAERLFHEHAGIVIGVSRHLEGNEQNNLIIEMISVEAINTSAIEGRGLGP